MKNKGVKRVLAMAVATVLVLETLPSVTVFAEETESTSVQEDLTEPQQAQREDRSNSWRYKDGTPILSDTFAPPNIATNGLSGLFNASPKNFSSFSIKNPDTAGK